MTIFDIIHKTVQKFELFNYEHKLLLALSGGVDSIVLFDFLIKSNYKFSVAHCNFKLRGKDSDEDEEFVKDLCSTQHIKVYSKSFETLNYAKNQGVSIQMAARDLRYKWFNELIKKEKFDSFITAHHKNDLVETLLLNLIRGTGRKGLESISYKNDHCVRPLLNVSKSEIIDFAKKNNLKWREDSSNSKSDYKRNLLRNKIIPLLEVLNPNFIHTSAKNIERFKLENQLIHNSIQSKKKFIDFQKNKIEIPIKEVENGFVLYSLIEDYGFNYAQSVDLYEANERSKFIDSETHRCEREKQCFVIYKLENIKNDDLKIKDYGLYNFVNKCFKLEAIENENELFFSERTYYFDADKIKFPITIRLWKHGDFIKPLGMKGKKKVSDLLNEQKLSIEQKAKVWVLESNDIIHWVSIGRNSEKSKITKSTKKVIKLEYY